MWDVFISHASEDKETVAGPLARALKQAGLSVWYDDYTLEIGDSLRRSIDRGISESRFGVVIFSPAFFGKNWPQRELDGLTTREVSSGKRILPVWHNVTQQDVERYSPTLADKVGVPTAKGLDDVVQAILRVVKPGASLNVEASFDLSNFAARSVFPSQPAVKWKPDKKIVLAMNLGYAPYFAFTRDWEAREHSADGILTRDALNEYIKKKLSERARKHDRGASTQLIDSEIDRSRRILATMEKDKVDGIDYLQEKLKDCPLYLRRLATEILNLDDPPTGGEIVQRTPDNARSRCHAEPQKLKRIDELAKVLGLF